jgi:hypothetical protein
MKYGLALLVSLLLAGVVFINSPSNFTSTVAFTNDLQWNRYTDAQSNFEILSLDDQQGKYLYDNLDNLKAWVLTRWALPNEAFPTKCKVIVVSNKDQFKEFFAKESPQYRVTKDANGQIKELTIWLSSDTPHWNTGVLTKVLTEVCLQNFEVKNGKVDFWVHRGMSVVNGDLSSLRQSLGNLSLIFQKNLPIYSTKDLLEMTPETLAKHPSEVSVWYESESACFLLMLYKEFGPRKFNAFLSQSRTTGPEAALRSVYGFNAYADVDIAFRNYMFNLSNEITGKGQQVTPNSSITWELPR